MVKPGTKTVICRICGVLLLLVALSVCVVIFRTVRGGNNKDDQAAIKGPVDAVLNGKTYVGY